MKDDQKAFYNELKNHFKIELAKSLDNFDSGEYLIKLLQGLMRLRQGACLPEIISCEFKSISSIKMTALQEILDDILSENHRILLFSQFTSILACIKEFLDKRKFRYCYLDGNTREREAVINDFQNNPEKRIFLISLKAGGVGINLTAADYVILFDPWWNPAVENQAIDRAHRIGQDKKVIVLKLIVKNTIEEKMLLLQEKKQELADRLINEDKGILKTITREDFDFLME